jgi:hypothetical protein
VEINNEHSSNAETSIRTNLEDPNKLQAKYNYTGFKKIEIEQLVLKQK